jgi:cephalosporin-C deacetylase-like acetyl esterase
MLKKVTSIILIILTQVLSLLAEIPQQEPVKVIVTPNNSDWRYSVGENASFTIQVFRFSTPLCGIVVKYKIQPELQKTWQEGEITLINGTAKLKADKFQVPGFLRCTATVVVDKISYTGMATVGFSPEKIEPTTNLPKDFTQFWDEAKKDLSKVSIDAQMTLLPERCTDKVDVYHVSMNNIQGKWYGILCRPKAQGKYPAVLEIPGAGVWPFYGDVKLAEKGLITLQIGIHGIPLNLEQDVYTDLYKGPLKYYKTMNLDDRDNYYYKRVYMGCVRSVDFIETLDFFDGTNLAVTGGSQGGGLTLITTALDARVKYLAVFYPALCDLTGALYGRAEGWPHLFRDSFTNKPEKIETSKYYDAVNFARFVTVPGWYSWGYNDESCPPTTSYAAFNVIPGKKELHIFQDTGHWHYPVQDELKNQWLLKMLSQKL